MRARGSGDNVDALKNDTDMTENKDCEKAVECRLRKGIEALGGLCLKYTSGITAGYPDRLCMMPGGHSFWVELKTKGQKPRPLQLMCHRRLQALGFLVLVIDTADKVDKLLEELRDDL